MASAQSKKKSHIAALLMVALGILLNKLYWSHFYSYIHWAFSFLVKNTKVQYSANVAISGFLHL